MNEREMLATLCQFLVSQQIVIGDEASIKDMVVRYKQSPMSLFYPVCLRMTIKDMDKLNELLKQAHTLLASNEVTPLMTPIVHVEKPDEH